MIEVIEGRLGGGKTYLSVQRMLHHWRMGGVVCTNVDLIWDGCMEFGRRRFGLEFQSDQVISLQESQICEFYKYTPAGTDALPVLVVLDEIHLYFNSRDFALTDRMYRETLNFLTESRKDDTDVIFISQNALNMDKQFLRLVQYIWRSRDLARWKIPGLGIASPWKGIVACQFDYDGKTLLQRDFLRKDPELFRCYRTKSRLRKFPRLDGVSTKRELVRVPGYGRGARVLFWVLAFVDLVIWTLVVLKK